MTYVNPGSITTIGILFPTLTVVSLILRVKSWRQQGRPLEVDDFLIFPAGVCTITISVFKISSPLADYLQIMTVATGLPLAVGACSNLIATSTIHGNFG